MTDHVLEQLVVELQAAIARSEALAGEERQHLEELARRISARVEDEDHGIVDQIGETVGHFETEHPALVETLNRIAQTLNAAGL